MSKTEWITLDCGVKAEKWTYKHKRELYEYLEISLNDLYSGYGTGNDLGLMAKLFNELHTKGYTAQGMSLVNGYYDSIDDVILKAKKKI